ncbi:MAG: lipoyl synthase [bacterium]|nr:lipoyl synthase [bacterium]
MDNNSLDSKDEKILKTGRQRLPEWIRVKAHAGIGRKKVTKILSEKGLHTVCESAKCPNLGECWHKQTATFMILGDICTRNCQFCAVKHGEPGKVDLDEPDKVAKAVKEMNLKYAVVTSVTRDDLTDGGASIFAETIKKIKEYSSGKILVEVLTPDFDGNLDALKIVLDANPTVFNHNLETVKRLSKEIRLHADYDKSLHVLKKAVEISGGKIPVKSGIMVGMGETDEEVIQALDDLKEVGVSILTIGQYLPPNSNKWKLKRYVHPDVFEQWKKYALSIGFRHVASSPLVRSSYCAEELLDN